MKNSDLDLKYEDVLPKLPLNLQKKLEYSVNLLRKAEKLANAYDPQNGYFLAFSGGKDSQALFHVAKLARVRFKAHMNFTSVDPPEVIRFVRHEYPDIETIKPRDSIYHIAVQRKILPTMRVRWCCQEFKESAGAGKVTLIGIRHEESARRAKRNEVEINSRKFSGNLEGLDEYRKEFFQKKRNKNKAVTIVNADGEQTIGCISGKESILISPIIHWSEKDVWTLLNTMGVKHCSLYDEGYRRIGCIMCPMSQRKQKVMEILRYPHVKRNWIRAIKTIRNSGVFADGYVWWNIKYTDFLRGLRKGFLHGSSFDRLSDEQKEDLIAEKIFEWWISGKSYKEWMAVEAQGSLFDDSQINKTHFNIYGLQKEN